MCDSFQFCSIGFNGKTHSIAVRNSGHPSPLSAYSTIPYTPPPYIYIFSSFLVYFLLPLFCLRRNTSDYTRRRQRNVFPIFKVFHLSLSIPPQKPSLCTYIMGHNVSEQTDSCTGSFHSSGDQTMWLNK